MSGGRAPRAVVFGLAGLAVSPEERALFAASDPLGFILFARNCHSPEQVRALTRELRAIVGRDDAPILIDQEGGRVQRLKPPHWRAAPPAAAFGALARVDESAAVEAAYLDARLIGSELAALGITVDCAPVLDLPAAGADPIIGDRAFAPDPALAALLAQAFCAGLLAEGVAPVIKHIPGHGRAGADSHLTLPVISAARSDLEAADFAVFHALRDAPWAMTAHVVYSAIDPAGPATTSAALIADVVRGAIGFDGLLVSDDLCMRALDGPPAASAGRALAAGCDVVLHCNGDLEEMRALAAACPQMTPEAMARFERAEAARRAAGPVPPADGAALARLDELLARVAA